MNTPQRNQNEQSKVNQYIGKSIHLKGTPEDLRKTKEVDLVPTKTKVRAALKTFDVEMHVEKTRWLINFGEDRKKPKHLATTVANKETERPKQNTAEAGKRLWFPCTNKRRSKTSEWLHEKAKITVRRKKNQRKIENRKFWVASWWYIVQLAQTKRKRTSRTKKEGKTKVEKKLILTSQLKILKRRHQLRTRAPRLAPRQNAWPSPTRTSKQPVDECADSCQLWTTIYTRKSNQCSKLQQKVQQRKMFNENTTGRAASLEDYTI